MSITEDTLLGGRVRLLQPADGYRAAIDPVLLSAAVPATSGDRVLELGAGSGAASLCLGTRVADVYVLGLEIQVDLAKLANESAQLNDLGDRVIFMPGDVLNPPGVIDGGGYDHVIANPPYLKDDHGHPPPDPAKAMANVEGAAKLVDWLETAVRLVKDRGTVTIIHRADRLDEILSHLHDHLGAITVCPLWPKAGEAAKRVIISGRKGVATPTVMHPGLILHEDGGYTAAAEDILGGGVLDLS